jgi:HEAT repeat protein
MKLTVSFLALLIVSGIYLATRRAEKIESSNYSAKDPTSIVTSPLPSPDKLPIDSTISQPEKPKVNPGIETNTISEIGPRMEAIAEASMKSDSNSFQIILNALKDENPEIRRAALDGVIQFGSRDAIPALKELVEKTEDPREKVEILDAIEFLALPSATEIREPRRTNSGSSLRR